MISKMISFKCVNDQVTFYGDLCAESSSGYEKLSGAEAHYLGVRCAVDSILGCEVGKNPTIISLQVFFAGAGLVLSIVALIWFYNFITSPGSLNE